MIKIKALGLAAFAVMALGVFSAATASAAEFHSESINTQWFGTQTAEDVITTNAGTIRCDHKHYSGSQGPKTSSTLTVTPIYTGCLAFGFVNTTIDHNECKYVFHSQASTAGTESSGSLSISCPAGKVITVTAFNCWVTIGTQGPLPGVTYHNTGSGSGRFFDFALNLKNITYTQHSKSFPGCTNGHFSNGTFQGGGHIKGTTSGGNPVGIWVH